MLMVGVSGNAATAHRPMTNGCYGQRPIKRLSFPSTQHICGSSVAMQFHEERFLSAKIPGQVLLQQGEE